MKLSSLAWEAAMYRARLFAYALLLIVALPIAVRADEPPETLELAEGRFRVTLEWAEDPAGEPWVLDLGGDGGMFGATDGGEVARLEVAEESAGGRLRAVYRANERVAAFVVIDLASGVTRRFPVTGSGVLELDPAVFAAAAAAKVVPVLDTARAVSAFVGPNGGVVTATDAGGVKFTLTLPKGALLTVQEITLTPLVSLGGFPFTPGFVAVVEVKPEGLRLWKLGTLKVETPAPVPVADRVTFGYRPANQQLFLVPSARGTVLTLPVTRLGGLGVGRGTAAQVAAQWKRVPSHPSDQLDQQLAQAGAVVGQTGAAEGFSEAKAAKCANSLDQELLSFFQKEIVKKLKTATKDCSAFRTFLRTASSWDVLGASGKCTALKTASNQVNAVYKKGLRKCFDESFGKCVKLDIDAAHELLGAHRLLKSLGAGKTDDTTKIGKCVRFDLTFLSNMEITNEVGQKELLGVKSTVAIRQAGAIFKGEGVTSWDQATCLSPSSGDVANGCTCTASPKKPGRFTADLDLKGSSIEFEYLGPTLSKIIYDRWLNIGTTIPTYRLVIDCGSPPVDDFDQYPTWHVAWFHLHLGEMRPGATGIIWLIRGWTNRNLGVLEKVYKRPGLFGLSQVQEDSALYLNHKPQP